MIGGGGNRIGQPPGAAPPVAAEPHTNESSASGAKAKSGPERPGDSFEKAASRPSAPGSAAAGLGHGGSGGDLLKLAKENPHAAARIVDGLATQGKALLGEIERELAAANTVLEKLANERFTKAARDKIGAELRRRRDKIASLKLRHRTGMRKMALLQQVGGRLDEPDLEREIERVLSHHGKLKTDWGRRHHLLSLGELLFSAGDDAPEHLREVVRADVRAGAPGDEVGEAMHAVSPRRVIAELIARTLDGSTRQPGEPGVEAAREHGDLGRSMQSYEKLADLLESSLAKDPLSK